MIKVLVVDDSALMRKLISDSLSSDSEIEVVGTAINGKFALDKIRRLGPDVVLMDLEMPEMDGITALKRIMVEWPLPVIILSTHSKRDSAKALDAMKFGAVDFILNPAEKSINQIKDKIIRKIKTVALARLHKFKKIVTKKHYFISTRKKIIIIGSSTGGPQTLEALLTGLPKNIPVPILIVQHMPPLFTKSLAERLDKICEIEVREAQEGDELKAGVALIAPGGFHMELKSDIDGFEGTISLNKKPPELGIRPNINRLFKSVTPIFKENTIGVILTGMGMDGTEGCKTIKEYGGTVIAEAENSCIIYGMPKSVIEKGLADEIVELEDMAVALVQLVDI